MNWNRINLDIDALDLFETITELRVVRAVLKHAVPGEKFTMEDISQLARVPLTQAKRGIATALSNGTLVARALEGKTMLRTYEVGPKLAPFIWAQSVPESYNAAKDLGTERDQTLSDPGTKCDQNPDPGTECAQIEPLVDTRDKGTQEFNLEPEGDKSPSLSPDAYTPEFEDAWKRYGRKDDKRGAFRAWKRIPVKRRAEVLRAIDAIAAARAVDFRPYLGKFLRNGWGDWTHGPPNGKQATRLPGDSTVNPSKAAGSQPFVNPFRGGPK